MPSMKKKISKLRLTIDVGMVPSIVILLAMTVQAQPAPEISIDRIFRYESSSVGGKSQGQLVGSFKKWMGAYQRIRKDGDNYVAVFDSGSLPIDVKFKANGSIESIIFGCPISKSLSLINAPENLQKALSKCGGFKS
jgi:hypothetical protein